jgi:hypothetical protein
MTGLRAGAPPSRWAGGRCRVVCPVLVNAATRAWPRPAEADKGGRQVSVLAVHDAASAPSPVVLLCRWGKYSVIVAVGEGSVTAAIPGPQPCVVLVPFPVTAGRIMRA